MDESKIDKFNTAFWLIFFLIPMFTGWMVYQSLPQEYDENRHELLESHAVECGTEGMASCDVPDLWRDKETGQEYSSDQFADHRRSEAVRIASIAFMYGLLGCAFFAFVTSKREQISLTKSFRDIGNNGNQKYIQERTRDVFIHSLKKAIVIDVVVAIFLFNIV